ncbi:group 3 secretory phospholipase A2 [Hypanus sabinus]|uniref:group 3 secretory phospholipase A2 n=1 Tax=Hypanus sabinus TaxID=79690 RepID=UPI0028C50590|nr:group 3 secretory phospholipase A2 [Hypanus sabinus]
MLVGGCLLCLLYFCSAAGQAAWLKGGLATLGHENGTLCHLLSGNGSVRSWSFLARIGGGLVFFQTLWSGQGELEQCAVRREASIIRTYLTFCFRTHDGAGAAAAGGLLGLSEPRLQRQLKLLQQVAAARCSPSPAVPGSPRRDKSSDPPATWFHRQGGRGASRTRRGLTVPGTFWCGAGDSAESYGDLGTFNWTDACCREHDHCEHTIAAFEYNYGMLNFRLHTISHCDCDYRFKKCLLDVNNTISTMVGVTYFNIFQIPCFSLQPVDHCMKKTLSSSCRATELTHQAFVQSPSPYDYPHPTVDDKVGQLPVSTERPATTSRVNKIASSVSVEFVYPTSQQGATQKSQKSKEKCRNCSGRQKLGTKDASQNTLKSRTEFGGGSQTCGCYKPLDRCVHKILPQEFKFSLYNQEPKTLYHCKCMRRFAKQMKVETNVKIVKELFFRFVSQSCFQLKSVPMNCSREGPVLCGSQSNSTVAILSKPRYLQNIMKGWGTGGESLFPSPDEQERNQNGTLNSTDSVKLYHHCLQIIRTSPVKS